MMELATFNNLEPTDYGVRKELNYLSLAIHKGNLCLIGDDGRRIAKSKNVSVFSETGGAVKVTTTFYITRNILIAEDMVD